MTYGIPRPTVVGRQNIFSQEFQQQYAATEETAAEFLRIKPAIEALLFANESPPPLRDIEAFITGYTLDGSRWTYDWEQAVMDNATMKFVTVTGGLNSVDHGLAYNTVENGNDNTSWESAGENVSFSGAPATFYLQPIRGGTGTTANPGTSGSWSTSIAPCVILSQRLDNAGEAYWAFSLRNAYTGTCA